jgi:hypothetical protein
MGRMARTVVAAGIAMTLSAASGIGAGTQPNGERQKHAGCSERTLRGTHGIQVQGTRPAGPGPNPPIESVVGVVIRTYDGDGSFTQIGNVKGSMTGIVPDSQGFGTYRVNEDCTAIGYLQPAPGITIEERLVIVDHGRELRSIAASPPLVMVTGVHLRID